MFCYGEERAGCFTLIVFLMGCDCVLWLFHMIPWVGLQCVIVVFPDHTHCLFIIGRHECILVYQLLVYDGVLVDNLNR